MVSVDNSQTFGIQGLVNMLMDSPFPTILQTPFEMLSFTLTIPFQNMEFAPLHFAFRKFPTLIYCFLITSAHISLEPVNGCQPHLD